eukprot:372872-Prymnesium_polylepis.1
MTNCCRRPAAAAAQVLLGHHRVEHADDRHQHPQRRREQVRAARDAPAASRSHGSARPALSLPSAAAALRPETRSAGLRVRHVPKHVPYPYPFSPASAEKPLRTLLRS